MLPSSPLYPRACRVCVLVVSFVAFSVKLSVAKAPCQVKISQRPLSVLQKDSLPVIFPDSISIAVFPNGITDSLKHYLKGTGKRILSAGKDLKPGAGLDRIRGKLGVDQIMPSIEKPSLKKLLADHQVSVTEEGQIDRTYWGGGYYFLNKLQVDASVQVARIPLTVQFLHQDYLYPSLNYNNIFHASFDKETFLDRYRKQLKEKLDINKLVPKDDMLQLAKAAAEAAVKRELDSMKQEFAASFREQLPALDTIRELSTNNIGSVFQSLLGSNYNGAIKEKEAKLRQLTDQVQSGKINEQSIAAIPPLRKEIAVYYKVLSYYQRYQTLVKQLDLTGIENKISAEGVARAEKFKAMLDNPSGLQQLAADHLQMSGLEKLFMYVQQMNMGQHTVSLSPLSLYNYQTSGVSMEIFKDNKYLFLLAGKERDLNSIYDRSYFSIQPQDDHVATGVRVGRGGLKENHTHLSVFSFRQSKMSGGGNTFNMPVKSTLVLGLSNRFRISEESVIDVELSKSSATFKDALYGNDTAGHRRSAVSEIVNGANFGQSLAVNVNYTGTFSDIGLNVNGNLSHVASAYYNPGAYFMPGGTKQAALSLRKSFFKNAFIINARGNLNEYAYSMLPGNKWRNSSYVLETRFKLNNAQQLSLKYLPVRRISITPGMHRLNNATDRFSAEMNFQQRFRRVFYRNTFNLTYNQSRYVWYSDSLASLKAVTLSSLQTIMIGQQMIYWNVNYTYAHNPGGPVYLNSALTTDAGITYMLTKQISATSGINYSATQGFYKQAGLRQTFSATVNDHLQFNFFVDCRRNIALYQSYYDDLIRADWSVKYSF